MTGHLDVRIVLIAGFLLILTLSPALAQDSQTTATDPQIGAGSQAEDEMSPSGRVLLNNQTSPAFDFRILATDPPPPPPPPPPPQVATTLPVTLQGQQTNMWCWAATGQMTMAYGNRKQVAQCTEANDYLGRTDCCNISKCPNPPTSGPCVQGGWPQYSTYGFNYNITSWGTALTFSQLQAQINANLPTNFSWGWTGGGGHIMVAAGYQTPVQYVLKYDPWAPCQGAISWITYSAYVSSSSYTHWRDYYNVNN